MFSSKCGIFVRKYILIGILNRLFLDFHSIFYAQRQLLKIMEIVYKSEVYITSNLRVQNRFPNAMIYVVLI